METTIRAGRLASVGLVALLGAGSGCGDPGAFSEAVASEAQAIVGGAPVQPNEFPWQGRIGVASPNCGASLLTSRWALTAAHCMLFIPPAQRVFTFGDHNYKLAEGTEQTRAVARYYSHLWELGKYNNDIALVELSSPVTLNSAVQPIAFFGRAAVAGATGTATGWGTLFEGGPQPDVLQKAALPVVADSNCGTPGDSLVCVGDSDGSPGACHGDSGGPFTSVIDAGPYLTGVFSAVIDNCHSYSGYTRVSQFTPWIRNTVYGPLTVGARLASGFLALRRYNESTATWGAWTNLADGLATTGPAMTLDNSGRQLAFACSGGTVRQRTSTNDGVTWSAWSLMGGNCVDSPAVTVSRDDPPQVVVFARGSDNVLRFAKWTGGQVNFTALDGTVAFSPSATTNRWGRLWVFSRGTNGVIFYRFREADATAWSGWFAMPATVFSSGPAALETAQGQLHVVAVQANGTLMRSYYNPVTNGFTAWQSLGTGFHTTSAPALVESHGGTRLNLFARTSGNVLSHRFQDITTEGWSAWTSLGGTLTTGPAAL